MIDTHCHLTFPELSGRLEQVLAGAQQAGVDRMITIGTTPYDADRARALAQSHPQVYFAAGIHPHYGPQVPAHHWPRLAELAADPRCLAFGEMGLDYHYDDPPREVQHKLFRAKLEIIRYSELPKPIIIHCRRAVQDTASIIRGSGLAGSRFVFHCFTESPVELEHVLDLGAMVSFTGIVTYRNAPEVREAAKLVPLDRLMVETDAPYLTPEPHRKIRPNEPKFVTATARFLADLRGMAY
jgi:TatD DNase family protein